MMHFIFLHGLLGTKADWNGVIEKLRFSAPRFRCIALDLPLHGSAKNHCVNGFEDTVDYLARRIRQEVGCEPYILIGYSLGGRIALYYALHAQVEKGNLRALILEGANLGLKTEQERKLRWQNDEFWATRFVCESPQSVLNDWYRQSVFAHLTESQRQSLIAKRTPNCGSNIAAMLKATSLAKQPYLGEALKQSPLPIYYIVGEKDQKFRQLAEQEQLNHRLIPYAGHNAHLENPAEFAKNVIETEMISRLLYPNKY